MSDTLKKLFSAIQGKKEDVKPSATRESFAVDTLTKAGVDLDALFAAGDPDHFGKKLSAEVKRLKSEATSATERASKAETSASDAIAKANESEKRFKALSDQVTALGFDASKPLKEQVEASVKKEATAIAVEHSASRGISPTKATANTETRADLNKQYAEAKTASERLAVWNKIKSL